MATYSPARTKEPVDTEQLFSTLFLFAGPVVAFVVAVILGW